MAAPHVTAPDPEPAATSPAPAPPPAAAPVTPAPIPPAAADWNLKFNAPDSLPYKQQKMISLVIETNHPVGAEVFGADHPGQVMGDKIAKFPFAVATLTVTDGVAGVVAESPPCQQVTPDVNPQWDWGVTATTDQPFKLRLEVDQVSACTGSPAIRQEVKDYPIVVNAAWWQKALIWGLDVKTFLLAAFAFIVAAGGAVAALRAMLSNKGK